MNASMRGVAALAATAIVLPLILLVVRVLAFDSPPEVLVLDVAIMSIGTAGMVLFLTVHLHGLLVTSLGTVQARLVDLHDGRFDRPAIEQGPAEIREIARAANVLASDMEHLAQVTAGRSGANAMASVLMGLAHEVNNPLAHIQMQLQMLPTSEGATSMQRGTNRLQELVETLRTCSAQPGQHDVSRLVRGAVMVAQGALLECQYEIQAAPTAVECAPKQVVFALAALLHNAVEAGANHVRISTKALAGSVEIQVLDNGRGLPGGLENRLFEPFLTTKAGHAGLGLSLAAEAVGQSAGEVGLEAIPGGTRAWIHLPVA